LIFFEKTIPKIIMPLSEFRQAMGMSLHKKIPNQQADPEFPISI